jgi:hypothetical protein
MNNHSEQKQLYIPEKLRVGFQERQGTYNGRLAYVIYIDHKGTLRKEASWRSWRDHKIDPLELDNKPTDGFVLNKGVGGARESYGWNARNEYIRVYDPRGFEFEISVANLLFILQETTCSPGKGLEGKFVYAWDKDKLVLLPVSSQDYKSCVEYTELQSKKISVKDIKFGEIYQDKKQRKMLYLGKFECFNNRKSKTKQGLKYHVFHSLEEKSNDVLGVSTKIKKRIYDNFIFCKDIKNLSLKIGESPAEENAKLIDLFNNSRYSSRIKRLFLEKDNENPLGWDPNEPLFIESDSNFYNFKSDYDYNRRYHATIDKIGLSGDKTIYCSNVYLYDQSQYYRWSRDEKSISFNPDIPKQVIDNKNSPGTSLSLYAELENGNVIKVYQKNHNNTRYENVFCRYNSYWFG